MNKFISLRLRYFPFPGRASPIRDALNIGHISFIDEHIAPDQLAEHRKAGSFPFGALPVMEIETENGKICSAQSNAILRFAGRLSGLYPMEEPLQALKVDEALDMGEDINSLIGPSLYEQDIEKKMAMRKILAEKTLPFWMECFERLLINNGRSGYMVGNTLTIADLKLYWIINWLTSGILDGIPTGLIDKFENVSSWYKNISAERETRLVLKATG